MIDLKEQAGVAMNVRGQLSDPIADPQVTLGALAFASDLGRLLWRMKYGQDVKRAGLNRATLLLASRIRHDRHFKRAKFTGLTRAARHDRNAGRAFEREWADTIERFARAAIVEWVADQCPTCEGRGVVGRGDEVPTVETTCTFCQGARYVCVDELRIPFAARRDGRGPMVFREYARCGECNGLGRVRVALTGKRIGRQICPNCQGSAKRVPDHAARAIALGVPIARYRAHWQPLFHGVLAMLDAIDASANDTVRRRIRR